MAVGRVSDGKLYGIRTDVDCCEFQIPRVYPIFAPTIHNFEAKGREQFVNSAAYSRAHVVER
jgi:hypothetical protein